MKVEDFQRVKIEIATQVMHNGVRKTLKKDYWVICSEEALQDTKSNLRSLENKS